MGEPASFLSEVAAAVPLVEGDLVALEDRVLDEDGNVCWKPRAYGMVFRVRAPWFWAFWSDEGKDRYEEPCGLSEVAGVQNDELLMFRYRKFA